MKRVVISVVLAAAMTLSTVIAGPATAATSFVDVKSTTAFQKEITWLASTGVTTGWKTSTGAYEFRPLQNVNRDVMAAFLYRLQGSPQYTAPATSPFKDVPRNHVFYKEICWLNSKGISTGWAVSGGREYRPTQSVNRDTMAAFLYRLAGKPSFTPPSKPLFRDVPTSHVFYKEISWLAASGITTGWPASYGSVYRPTLSVKRDVMAAFLYRYKNTANLRPATPAHTSPGNTKNCSDFTTWRQAQDWFEYYRWLGFGDVADLDGDDDGIACEGLR